MSMRFIKVANEVQYDALRADDSAGGSLTPTLPITVLLWLRFDAAPQASETWAIWWYGQRATQDNALRLSATRHANGGIQFVAELRGSSGSFSVTSGEFQAGQWHQVGVLLSVAQGTYSLTLRVNDTSDATNVGDPAVDEAQWSVISLGARTDGNQTPEPGSFRAEHFAIWNATISLNDFQTMYTDGIAPWDADVAEIGLSIGKPSVAYWVLAGHSSGGIPVVQSESYRGDESGQFYNYGTLADIGRPFLDWHSGDPEWSAHGPLIRYRRNATIPPIPGPRKATTSRRDPMFAYWDGPSPARGSSFAPREHPMNFEPNFLRYARMNPLDRHSFLPPGAAGLQFSPSTSIGIMAKRIADWFELQAFTKGRGSAGGGDYEGVMHLAKIAEQEWEAPGEGIGAKRKLGQPIGVEGGSGVGIPLQEHALDAVGPVSSPNQIDPRYKWSTWFRASGTKLVKEYFDHFWPALKAELDARGLCYPKRLFWDYESFPRPNEAIRMDQGEPTGNFTPQALDDRADSEQLAGPTAPTTLSALFDDWGGTYTDLGTIGTNLPFFNEFWEPWSVVLRQYALAESVFSTAKEVFPETKWSNYWGYRADNPDYLYPEDLDVLWHNTPSGVTVPGDYSSPKLYSRNGANLRRTDPEDNLGMDYATIVRRLKKARIDACVNAQEPMPLAPWVENFGHSWMYTPPGPGEGDPLVYRTTAEDLWSDLTYLWFRGCNEYIVFSWDDGEYDASYYLCKRLVDWVHFMPVAAHDRVGRVSRLGRR